MKLQDLTHKIRIGTDGFPGCARIIGWPMREISWSHYNMLHISTDLHTGTHLDSMLHCIPDGCDAAKLSLSHCVGRAFVVDLTHKGNAGAQFAITDFEPFEDKIQALRKVLIKTGWSRHWSTQQYHDQFPGFEREAAEYLANLDIHLIGLEQPSVHCIEHLAIHKIFFNKNIIIVEGLTELNSIPVDEVEFFAAPLRFEGADGSPTRAFCRF